MTIKKFETFIAVILFCQIFYTVTGTAILKFSYISFWPISTEIPLLHLWNIVARFSVVAYLPV